MFFNICLGLCVDTFYLLNGVHVIAVQPSQKPVLDNDNGRRAPSQPDQPADEIFLRNESGHQHCVQIEAFAQHPGVIRKQEIVQD